MAEFAYNNAKNTNTSYTLFELNCSYYLKVFFEENVDLCSNFCSANKLVEELGKLIEICYQNLVHT